MIPTPSSSETESSATPTASNPDRSKTSTACYNCRQRKLRCDGSKPSCSNCQLYKTDCSYAQGRNKSGPPRGYKRKPKADSGTGNTKRSRRSSSVSSQRASSSDRLPTVSRSASPPENSIGAIPSLIGPLSSEWVTEWGVSWIDQLVQSSSGINDDDFAGTWSFPPSESEIGVESNPLLLPDYLSTSPTSFPAAEDTSSPSILPITSTSISTAYLTPNSSTARSPISHPSPQSSPIASTILPVDNAQSTSYSLEPQHHSQSSHLQAFRLIHAFVPIFPFHELDHLISDCEARKGHNIHAAFFLSTFHSLSEVASTGLSCQVPLHQYAAAKQQSMEAYFALINDSTVGGRDICYTAAGLVYLAVRAVFTHGWGKETSTWLRLAVDIIDLIPLASPMELGLRCWLTRIAWLWDKALTSCEPELPSVLLNTSSTLFSDARDGSPLSALDFDEDQRIISGLIELCLDLEGLIALNAASPSMNGSAIANVFGQYADIPGFAVLPLCERVQTWVKSSPITQEIFLQFSMEAKSHDEVRDCVGRVLHLVYYGMAIKFTDIDRVQCGLRKTSLVVALARLVDAASWIVTTRRLCLWPFAERALLLARDHLLLQSGGPGRPISPPLLHHSSCAFPSPPSTGTTTPIGVPFQPLPLDVRMMLLLIKDVFTEAHSTLDPATAGAQRTSAARAVESISAVLDQQESSKPSLNPSLPPDTALSEAMLAGLGQFFTSMPPNLLPLHHPQKC